MKIAEQFNVAVLLTNQVMADPGANASYAMDTKKPIGGNIKFLDLGQGLGLECEAS